MSGVARQALAKINLALAVDKARADGMHPLCSWMAPISLCDEIRVERVDGESAYRLAWLADAPAMRTIEWNQKDDLAVRAHRLLEERLGMDLPVRLSVGKRIPPGAGLGGGSSDAAAALLALRELFELDVTTEELCGFGAELGSDVPFFIADGELEPAIVSGVGERVERCAAVEGALILAMPQFGCSTAEVYRRFDSMAPDRFRAAEVEAMARGGDVSNAGLFNDLAAPAMAVSPELARLVEVMGAVLDAPAHVTGSGSGVFAIAEARHAHVRAEELQYELEARGIQCAVIDARFGEP